MRGVAGADAPAGGEEAASGGELTVVVCTHERPEDLVRCLRALSGQTTRGFETIVVDNAPVTGRTRRVADAAGVRYLREDRRGLNRARNAGMRAASAQLIAYTDDDAVPAPGWVSAIVRTLRQDGVSGMAGAVRPLELETAAQRLFERYLGGEAGRRHQNVRRRFGPEFPGAAAGKVGAGANMAFRRRELVRLGGFDEAFDAGMPTRSGGDTEIFARFLDAGFHLVYEPDAEILHRHRRSRAELRQQLFGYGVGVYAFWTQRVVEHRDSKALRFALGTLRTHGLRRLRRSLLRRADEVPPDLVLAELLGCLWGPFAYLRARRRAAAPAGAPSGELSRAESAGNTVA